MKTKNDLIRAVLSQLRIIGSVGDPSAEDASDVADHYDDVYAQLVDQGLCYWTNTDRTTEEIPDVVFRPLANIVSAEACDSFGKEEPVTYDETGEKIPVRAKGYRDLRRHMSKKPSGEATPFSSF